ncbi:hypothetical protein Acr_19g0005830 [Actinidia rufa]|uniref:Uncharacterized protein n=1 Tax=Actinidia rufa TaxID=165716 RepID=A0A7J0GA00_9ERIC|nr:hypothetical protein Acr_19g0005830 [Actinidia rufa]
MLDPGNDLLPPPSSPTISSISSSDLDTEEQEGGAAGGGGAAETEAVVEAVCRDDEDEDSRPSSLGEFLELERRLFSGATAEHESGVVGADQPRNGRLLFADGRVLPPAQEEAVPDGALCRFPVSLTGICR